MPFSVFSSLKISTAALLSCLQGLQANASSSHSAKRDRYPLCYIIHDYWQNCSICFSFCFGFLKVKKKTSQKERTGNDVSSNTLSGPPFDRSCHIHFRQMVRTNSFAFKNSREGPFRSFFRRSVQNSRQHPSTGYRKQPTYGNHCRHPHLYGYVRQMFHSYRLIRGR